MAKAEWNRERRRLLSAVKHAGGAPIALSDLTTLLGYESNNVLGGTYSSFRRSAMEAELNPDHVILRGPGRQFIAGPLLLANDLPWSAPATSTTHPTEAP